MPMPEDTGPPFTVKVGREITSVGAPDSAVDSFADLSNRYRNAIETLFRNFTTAALLDTLLSRDALEQAVLSGHVDKRRVDDVVESDRKLRCLPRRTLHGVRKDFVEWRQSLTPALDAWWWFLDRALPAPLERLEGIVLVLSVVLFPFSLGVAIELARLYGNDSSGFVSLLPIAATFLGSFSLGGVLSLSFRDRWTALLEGIGFGPRSRIVVTCLIAFLLGIIVALWFARPWLSRHYNDVGVSALAAQRPLIQLSAAQMNLERAVRFDPTNAVAHYNLGRVYEDLLEDDRAIGEYLVAFAAGLDLAGNNTGHLYLLRGQYDRAAFVLQRTFVLSDPQSKRGDDRELRYAVLKNFGWARLGQSRFSEARLLLEKAIRLDPDRADAHCLLAKTLHGMNDPAAQTEWRSCLGLAWQERNEPAREAWIGEAKAVIEKAQ